MGRARMESKGDSVAVFRRVRRLPPGAAPDNFTYRVPAKHRDRAPRSIKLADSGDAMTVENRVFVLPGLSLSGGQRESPWPVVRRWDIYRNNRLWIEKSVVLKPLPRKPSEYVLEHCYFGL